MSTFAWIVVLAFLMSGIASIGRLTLVLKQQTLDRILLPLVAFAAGSLIGEALSHMIPVSVKEMHNGITLYVWLGAGFILTLALQ